MSEPRGDALEIVPLATIHAAKAQEFSRVFLVGVEEGILPHRESTEDGKIDEKRRLMYVAITRARRQIFISHVLKRRRGQEWQSCEPSRFMAEKGANDLHMNGENLDAVAGRISGSPSLVALRSILGGKAHSAA